MLIIEREILVDLNGRHIDIGGMIMFTFLMKWAVRVRSGLHL
jgi:hypothetical protein